MSKLQAQEIEKLKSNLKEKGYKLTHQRRAILDIIIENEGKHLTAEEIYELVKIECPEIGLATVYRTVQLLEKLSVICRLNLDDGCNRYELIHEYEDHHHHHLICTKCGKVIEVREDLLGKIEETIEEEYKFRVKNHSVKFYGVCIDCKKSTY